MVNSESVKTPYWPEIAHCPVKTLSIKAYIIGSFIPEDRSETL